MAKELVTTKHNPITAMGNALARVHAYPDLSKAVGGLPRTILICRMLAGANDSDLLMASVLCFPRVQTFAIALFGDPAGPAYKTHPEKMKRRFYQDDPGAVGTLIDWRLALPDTPMIASFDPTCSPSLLQAVEVLTTDFEVPTDVIFMAARNEGTPGLLKHLQESAARVIIARPATMTSKFEPSDDLEVPALPQILAAQYASSQRSLRDLVATLPLGSSATFRSSLGKFSSKLEVKLHE